MLRYERNPEEIYAKSFATVRSETSLDHLPDDLQIVAIRMVHACGIPSMAARLAWSEDLVAKSRASLRAGAPILCDCQMVRSGIMEKRLPADNELICTLDHSELAERAQNIGNTRSAAAVEFWLPHLENAIVVIGNAPTALFHLLEIIDGGAPKPGAILAFPVGFVGAAESKAELVNNPRGIPYLTLRGRFGGSAVASAALNALLVGLGFS